MATITYERFENGLDRRIDKRAADANRMVVLDNAYVTTGRRLRKRPALTRVTQLTAGTVGLVAAPDKLVTFHDGAPGSIAHADSRFLAESIPGSSGAALLRVPMGLIYNGFVYASAQYADGSYNHHYLDGAVPPRVTDANCPNSESIQKLASKIFGPDEDTVRYNKTGDARDWTTSNDAGFIASGLNAKGDTTARAVGEFRERLAIHMIDSVQTWVTDPAPANIVIDKNLAGVGTKFPLSVSSVDADGIFLSVQGFRSITIAALNENLNSVDIGSPIDELVRPIVRTNPSPIGLYSQRTGQWWAIFGNYAFVYTLSQSSKLAAWSRYTFPFTIDAGCTWQGDLYLRSGNNVYVVDETAYTDDGAPIPVTIQFSFVDMKLPGIEKMITGCDAILKGSAELAFLYNPANDGYITSSVTISEDTAEGGVTPVEVSAVKVAPVITHSADEEFELETLTLYYDPLGAV